MIIGDANLSEISTYLKLGTTALVLSMIEDGFINVDLAVDQPVRTLHQVSHDPTLKQPDHAAQRPHPDRRAAPDGVLRAGPQVRRGAVRLGRGRADQGRPGPLGGHPRAGWRTTR